MRRFHFKNRPRRPFGRGKRFWRKRFHRRRGRWGHPYHAAKTSISLADVPPGRAARVESFTNSFPPDRKEHLQAYGLVPGYWVSVIQHSPVTVIQVEHTELAIEPELAREIRVSEIR